MPETPSPDVMVAIVRELREAHPSVGVKKFVGLAKAAHPHLKFGAREVREALDAIQSGVLPSETKSTCVASSSSSTFIASLGRSGYWYGQASLT